MVAAGPERVRELLDWGVAFSREGQALALGREGGHSQRRIVHVADYTGRELERVLLEKAAADPAITLLENHIAVNLALAQHLRGEGRERRVYGAYVLDAASGEVLADRGALDPAGHGRPGQGVRLHQQSRTSPPATVWPWPTGRGPRWPTWSSSSSTRPASTMPSSARSSSAKRCAARARCCATAPAKPSWSATTPAGTWRRGTSSPAPSTTR